MRGWPLFFLLAASSCGGKVHATAPIKPSFKVGAKVRIIDGTQIYDALNTVECVKWPSDNVKKKAGRDSWGGFIPGTGNEGTVLADLAGCEKNGKTEVVLVQVGDYVVPVTSKGVDTGDHVGTGDGSETYGGEGYGYGVGGLGYIGDGYGGDSYGADEYGGVIGGVVDPSGSATFAVGDSVTIVDTSYVNDTINDSDCLSWPSDDYKQRAGQDAWNGWFPSNGESGTVTALLPNNCGGNQFLLIDDGGNLVPIEVSGVKHP